MLLGFCLGWLFCLLVLLGCRLLSVRVVVGVRGLLCFFVWRGVF